MRFAVLVAVAALSAFPLRADKQSVLDATAVLDQTRQALGGDAALNAVTSIDVKGTLTRTLASRSFEQSVEYAAMLPDRFVEVTESTSDLGPLGSAFHQRRSGFAGDEPIDQDETDSPIPPPTIVTKAPTSAQRSPTNGRRLWPRGRRRSQRSSCRSLPHPSQRIRSRSRWSAASPVRPVPPTPSMQPGQTDLCTMSSSTHRRISSWASRGWPSRSWRFQSRPRQSYPRRVEAAASAPCHRHRFCRRIPLRTSAKFSGS